MSYQSLQIKDIRKGDEFVEEYHGKAAHFTATCDARRVEGRMSHADGWEVEATMTGGECNFYAVGDTGCRFFAADKGSAYGPHLYRGSL